MNYFINFEESSLQFSKQLFLRQLAVWFSISIHIDGVSPDLIQFASLKKRQN